MKTISKRGKLTVVGVKELHAGNWKLVLDEILRHWGPIKARQIDIDLSDIRFIDGHGLGALINLHRTTARCHGLLRLLNPSYTMLQILDLTRLDRMLQIAWNGAGDAVAEGPVQELEPGEAEAAFPPGPMDDRDPEAPTACRPVGLAPPGTTPATVAGCAAGSLAFLTPGAHQPEASDHVGRI